MKAVNLNFKKNHQANYGVLPGITCWVNTLDALVREACWSDVEIYPAEVELYQEPIWWDNPHYDPEAAQKAIASGVDLNGRTVKMRLWPGELIRGYIWFYAPDTQEQHERRRIPEIWWDPSHQIIKEMEYLFNA
jgi:hypothetical protein